MEFKVMPFVAQITQKDSSSQVAAQLQKVVNEHAREGWEYVRMDVIETNVAPTSGCFGIGAKPGYVTSCSMLIFKK